MMSHPWKRSLLALCLFSVILLGCILYWRWFREGESIVDAFQKETYSIKTGAFFSDGDVPVLSELDREMSKISSFASQSLVTISATGSSDVGYRSNNEDGRIGSHIVSRAQGSGVIVSKEGHIITNYHVIRGKSYIQAILGDGEVTTARVIGVDQLLDIAVLKIDLQKDLQPIPFGNSDEVKTGQIVMALGTPYGWAKTVTQGIVSGRDRKFNSVGINYIQTDATIHQGNSGGPLINIYGEMIGINSSILSGRISSGGTLGFAIPSNIVLQAFKQICEHGRPMRGYLGIDFVESSHRVSKISFIIRIRMELLSIPFVTILQPKRPDCRLGMSFLNVTETRSKRLRNCSGNWNPCREGIRSGLSSGARDVNYPLKLLSTIRRRNWS